MKSIFVRSLTLCWVLLIFPFVLNAQMKYDNNRRFTFGDTTPHSDSYKYYDLTIKGNVFLTGLEAGHFFQIDTNPAATRLASHYNQVVFYNTETSTFNSIQVKNVYNYSDARAKTNVQLLDKGLDYILKLRPVLYTFKENSEQGMFRKGGIRNNKYSFYS